MEKRQRAPRSPWFGIICTLLVIVGVGLILTPTIYSKLVQHRYQANVRVYKQEPKSTSKRTQRLRAYNQQLAAGHKYAVPLSANQLSHTIGYVSIPRIHVENQPIYYGDDDATLAHGVGVMPGTSLPIGGRSTLSVISGHSGFNNQVIFDNIRHLKNGDRFYVTALGQPRHTYRVYKRLVVAPSGQAALDPIRIQPGKDITVLLTCTPIFINSHRLLIFGRRVPAKAAQSTTATTPAPTNWALYIASGVIAAVVLAITVVLLVVRHQHQSKDKH